VHIHRPSVAVLLPVPRAEGENAIVFGAYVLRPVYPLVRRSTDSGCPYISRAILTVLRQQRRVRLVTGLGTRIQVGNETEDVVYVVVAEALFFVLHRHLGAVDEGVEAQFDDTTDSAHEAEACMRELTEWDERVASVVLDGDRHSPTSSKVGSLIGRNRACSSVEALSRELRRDG
jgi:hypothetical protein